MYTYKHLILTILLPILNVFTNNLETVTGQDIMNGTIFMCLYKLCNSYGIHITGTISTVLYLIIKVLVMVG
jgi:hypothetical protein